MSATEERKIDRFHNNPPEIVEQMAQEQLELYAEKLREIERIIVKENTVPKEISDDDTAGAASDFIKLAKSIIKESDNIRLAEKKKYTVKSDAIQSFWKKRLSPVEQAIERISERLAPYLQEKEDRKRRENEEKERLKKEIADKKLREAEEAERVAKAAAEKAQREAAEIKRKADEEAAEIRRKAAEDKKKADEEATAKQAEIDRLKKEKEDRDYQDFIKKQEDDAERKRVKELHDAELKKAKEASETAEAARIQANKEAREAEKSAKEKEKTADNQVKELNQEAREATKAKNHAIDAAVRADKDHARAERQTVAKASDLSRVRGDGSVASVGEYWIGSIKSREELFADAEILWEHIPFDALDQAVQSYVRAGGRDLKGAFITQERKTAVR